MTINTVAILSPGDMGHAVGQLLREHELRVVTCLTGRSDRTRALSEKAGIEDIADFNEMVKNSDVILSMTVSEVAPQVCQEVAEAIKSNGATDVLFAECNAIAPQLTRSLEPVIVETGARFVDASIIGGPPRGGSSPRFYASGPNAAELEQLREFGLDVRNIGPDTGQASGIKMCYAAMTKGSTALFSELLMAAELLGLSDHLRAEFQSSQAAVYQRMEGGIPTMPARSRRWVSEMEEISSTFEHLGMTPYIFKGVADMYRLIGSTPLGDERPEVTRDEHRSLEETIHLLAEHIDKSGQE